MGKCYRVLVADDHPLARKAIHSILQPDPTFLVVGEAETGSEAIFLCQELQPDLVLMDINMPNGNGLEATRRIKQDYPNVKVVMLSVSDDITDLFTAIQFGAQGYLLKNMEPEEWVTYLCSLMEGTTPVSREMAGKLLYQFREEKRIGEPQPSILTKREQEILCYLAHGETNRQLAQRFYISENTVKNHIKNLLEKLGLENRVQLASYAVRYGLTLLDYKG